MSRCISTSLIGFPRIRALPAVGKIRRISSLIVVDLPAPFGPINPNTSPVFTCIFNPSSDVLFLRFKNPKGYTLVRFSISIAASGMSSLLAKSSLTVNRSAQECARKENTKNETTKYGLVKSGVAAGLSDLHQVRLWRRLRSHRDRLQVLWVAPVIQYPHLLHARNRAPRRAKLFGRILPVPHFRRVLR